MISDEKLQAKAKELLDELDFQGYTRGEIAYLGTCFQSYAIHGELTKIKSGKA
jgi:hypothetical protein